MPTLKVGFSPCPNDTFMFDALVNGLIPIQHFDMELHIADVEELNHLAYRGYPDVTKISFSAYAGVAQQYQLLKTGAALGFGVGPLLIGREKMNSSAVDWSKLKVSIPGEQTTASLLLRTFFPEIKTTIPTLFSEIEEAVIQKKVDAGVIIHENRFTYEDKGLHLLADLGARWEKKMNLPLPLGGIAIKRTIPEPIKKEFATGLQKSIQLAFQYPNERMEYVRRYASEMDPLVMKQHIDLYVGVESEYLSEGSETAIEHLLNLAQKKEKKSFSREEIFFDHNQ